MGHLIVCGVNFHFHPLAIREHLVIPDSCLKHGLMALGQFPHLSESVILSTCNRTEVYAVVSDVSKGFAEIESFFRSVQQVSDHASLSPNYKLMGDDVALHLMRVASGLDSMVLGEGQIMSQVKFAHQCALEAKTAGAVMDNLFKSALNCGKKVRSQTSLGKRAVSISSAAVEIARDYFKERNVEFEKLKVTILGAGKMAKICLKHMLGSKKAPKEIRVVNRTKRDLLDCFQASKVSDQRVIEVNETFTFEERHQAIAQSDLVLVATSAHRHLLTKAETEKTLSGLKSKCLIVDISVPRNVDPELATIDGITLKHTDDLAELVNKNLDERKKVAQEADDIIFACLDEFTSWQKARSVVPTITELKEKVETIRQAHIQGAGSVEYKALSREEIARMEEISQAIVNQILHIPMVNLKAAASSSDIQALARQAETLRNLFNLDPLSKKCAFSQSQLQLQPNENSQLSQNHPVQPGKQ
ncbi:MAG: glutamyl-tRNA reductase [Candidatus Melainabacteria bacterium]|nr:glutamyl-tRNA reductase [Candidatus Melainabacteria bacterium]